MALVFSRMFALAASGIFSTVCASMFALNCFACSRRQARSQVVADAKLVDVNNAKAINGKWKIIFGVFGVIFVTPNILCEQLLLTGDYTNYGPGLRQGPAQ